jgi:tripartite-type tricarboxylate transporter receptor subunit TctC
MVPLAVTSAKRLSALPDVPTMSEAGLGAVEALSWGGLFAPARTPGGVVKRLSDELDIVMKSAEVRTSLDAAASFPMDMPHEAFQAYVAREAGKWGDVIRKAGAKLE